jgi:MoxR-like ATPase
VGNPAELVKLQEARKNIRLSPPVRDYITEIVRATRGHAALRLGASPRGSLALMRTGQALAALEGRDYVLPDDIKFLAIPVLAHRLIIKEEERLRGVTPENIIEEIMNRIPVPAPTE